MYYVYSDGELIMITANWETARYAAIEYIGYVADFAGRVLFADKYADCPGIKFNDYPEL